VQTETLRKKRILRRETDMTNGSIPRLLITFALPIMLGTLFQQFYNMVDTWVVGNFVSNEAFAAVGTSTPIINTMIGFFTGLSTGAGIIISQYYGARLYDKVHDVVHTYVTTILVLAAIFTFIGIWTAPTLLRFMGTAPEVMPQSTAYLRIYFSGVSGLLLYNMGSSILRAIGDSQRPFRFLVVAALLNIVLDFLFVLVFHMGVEGVAYATIISQGASALLTLRALIRSDSCIRLFPSHLRIHRDLLGRIIRIGLPSAIQMSINSFSNIFVNSYTYQFGADTMSGWAAYSKIFQLFILPSQSLGAAASTFVGQNLGNQNMDRAKEGVRTAIHLALIISIPLLATVWAIAPHLVYFFNKKEEVIALGTLFIRLQIPTLVFVCFDGIYLPALRGSGNSRTPMIILLLCYPAFRQVYLFIVSNYISNTLIPIVLAYPFGWLLCAVVSTIYYKKVGLSTVRLSNTQGK